MDGMRKQAQKFVAPDCRFETVTRVDLSRRPFAVSTLDPTPATPEAETAEYTADALIVATGASARTLGLDTRLHYMGYGLGTARPATGALYRGKKVGVIGGGDTAVEEATFLTRCSPTRSA